MVKKIASFFNKEISGLHQAAYLLGFFTVLSNLLALIRDRMLAAEFGAGRSLDLYYSAFRLPDFIFVTVGSLVAISVLVPFIIEKVAISEVETKKFINNIFSFFFLLIVIVSAIIFILAPYIIPKIFPGFIEPDFPILISMTRILLLSPILLGLSNFFGSITQVFKKFIIYSLSPLAYNLGIIIGILFFYPIWGLTGLTLGVILGAVVHLLIQIPFVYKQGLFPKLSFNLDWIGIKQVMMLSVPRTFTLAITQLTTLVLISMATFMEEGSIATFNFSINLQSVPLAIIGVSYSIAAFPTLAKYFTSGEKDKFINELVTSAKHIILWSIPISVLFIVLRAQIVRTVLGAGEFSWDNTRLTAACLAIFSISVVAQSLTLLFIRAYYAMGQTKKPLIMGLISGVLIIVLAYCFTKLFAWSVIFQYFIESMFRVGDIGGTSVLMLPLGYTVAVIINCILLWIYFAKVFPGFTKSLIKTAIQSLSASIFMGFTAYIFLNVFDDVFNLNTLLGIFLQGLCSGLIGIAAGIVILKLLNNPEISEVWRTLHSKIWKAKPLPVEISEI